MSRRLHDGQNTTMISLPRDAWCRFVAISTPIFHSAVRWQAIALLALLMALLLSITGLNILNSYVGRDFMTAVAQREAGRFAAFSGVLWAITLWLVVVAVVYALFGSLMTLVLGYRLVGFNVLQLHEGVLELGLDGTWAVHAALTAASA